MGRIACERQAVVGKTMCKNGSLEGFVWGLAVCGSMDWKDRKEIRVRIVDSI